MLKARAIAGLLTWLPFVFLAKPDSGTLLWLLPASGIILGIAPIRFFPWVFGLQLVLGAAVSVLLPVALAELALPVVFFGFGSLLNWALWLRVRKAAVAGSDASPVNKGL